MHANKRRASARKPVRPPRGATSRRLAAWTIPFLLAMAAPAGAEDAGFVVLGSWREAPLAEARQAEVRDRIGLHADIMPTEVHGERRYRLVSPAMAESAARAMIADLAARGVASWFLRAAATPGTAAPPAAADVATDPAPDEAASTAPPDALEPATTTAQSEARSAARSAPPAPRDGPAPGHDGPAASAAQDPDTGPAIHVPYLETADIEIDGYADEAAWSEVAGYDDMRVIDPDTLEEPEYRTVYRFLYTREGLYIAAFMEQPPDTFVSRLSSRDRYLNRDSFGLTLDTSGEGLYGYWFTVTPGRLADGRQGRARTHHHRGVGRPVARRERGARRRLERGDVPAVVDDGDALVQRRRRDPGAAQADLLGGPQGVAPRRTA